MEVGVPWVQDPMGVWCHGGLMPWGGEAVFTSALSASGTGGPDPNLCTLSLRQRKWGVALPRGCLRSAGDDSVKGSITEGRQCRLGGTEGGIRGSSQQRAAPGQSGHAPQSAGTPWCVLWCITKHYITCVGQVTEVRVTIMRSREQTKIILRPQYYIYRGGTQAAQRRHTGGTEAAQRRALGTIWAPCASHHMGPTCITPYGPHVHHNVWDPCASHHMGPMCITPYGPHVHYTIWAPCASHHTHQGNHASCSQGTTTPATP